MMSALKKINMDVKELLNQTSTLAQFPSWVRRLQRDIDSDSMTIDDMTRALNQDPSMVFKVMKVINSLYYSLDTKLDDIQHAVAYFGTKEISHIVLALSAFDILNMESATVLRKFWFHSFFSALCTRHLASKYEKFLSSEGLWAASVLHDIGKLALCRLYPDLYFALAKYRQHHGCLFADAEKHCSTFKSADIGAELCDHWGLPLDIKRACEFHSLDDLPHFCGRSLSDAFVRMICLGNLVAEFSSIELSEARKVSLFQSFIGALKCSKSEFLTIMGDIYAMRFEADRFAEDMSSAMNGQMQYP